MINLCVDNSTFNNPQPNVLCQQHYVFISYL